MWKGPDYQKFSMWKGPDYPKFSMWKGPDFPKFSMWKVKVSRPRAEHSSMKSVELTLPPRELTSEHKYYFCNVYLNKRFIWHPKTIEQTFPYFKKFYVSET